MVLHVSDSVVIGANDNVKVTESDGREWRTREPAICTFGRGQWFNTIAMIREDGIYYYCNIGSPFTMKHEVLSYIDYDLDVKVYPDMSFVLLDKEEFNLHGQLMNYPPDVVQQVNRAAEEVVAWVHEKRGAFHPGFVERWYERFLTLQNRS
ncbi:protein associated with RNAse G/E [Ammoniphilus resinae]|uniref:Protein associated with RNAse G/E n=2 Tax=Ammoniphilus resinae TaxID=861532 RepID=A0ABS4GJB8_9BACL|nr:protein associated with RNAse G/E [Ammoniphilus resinae]